MTEPTPNTSRKVTLEQLLRLKRHERPGPEYWARFDRELNEKVWRALANPPEEYAPGRMPVWLARGLRWMSAGAVSSMALLLLWHSESITPVAATVTPAHRVAAPEVVASATEVAAPAVPVLVASVIPSSAPVTMSSEKATFAMANLASSASPASFAKIPATMSFPVTSAAGQRYAADSLNSAAFSARSRGSAY